MKYTIFESEWGTRQLQENDIEIVGDARDADLFLTRAFPSSLTKKLKMWLKFRLSVTRSNRIPLLLWTHEPVFSSHTKSVYARNLFFPELHVMNVFNGDVHLSNYAVYGYNVSKRLRCVDCNGLNQTSGAQTVGLATYIPSRNRRKLRVGEADVDLSWKRQKLLMRGYQRGMVDIYGRGWPHEIAVENSRSSGWHERKIAILRSYRFNVCLENTDFPYYVTEKIWDSINAYCLPVYRGSQDRIYEDFPRSSFLDYGEFRNNDELLDYIERMSEDEYCDRLNKCIETNNRILDRGDFEEWRTRVVQKVIGRIHSIVH